MANIHPLRFETSPGNFSPVSSVAERPARQGLIAWLLAAHRRRLSRLMISQLDNHMLRDIGVSYAEAEAEANKPWWRA